MVPMPNARLLADGGRVRQLQHGHRRLELADCGDPILLLLARAEADVDSLPALDANREPVQVFPFARDALDCAFVGGCLRDCCGVGVGLVEYVNVALKMDLSSVEGDLRAI